MSNYLAIATVTAALGQQLQNAVGTDVPGASVRLGRPSAGATEPGPPEVSLFLYQLTPNLAFRNADLPMRDGSGQFTQRPRAAFDLHYLVSCSGDEQRLEPQRLLGAVVRTLHAQPVLCRQAIRDTIGNPAFAFLAASDLADEVELVKLTPAALSLEDMSKLWSVFFQIPYAVSIAYQASVVLIDETATIQPTLPVREPHVTVMVTS